MTFDPQAASSSLLQNLNPEQLAAVTLPPKPALILAGAGSGKTRVLTTRIAWLIQTGQLYPGGVMAVTFTNKAAKEMLTRLGAMLPIPVRGMWIGTFHGLCNRFLRAHWKLAGLPQGFQILDSSDQLSAVKRVIKAMNLDEERYVPKQVTWFIAAQKEEGRRPPDVEVRDEQSRLMVQVYAGYEAQCQREGVVDFAELMLRVYELMRDNASLREHYQRRFRHILVDEFQDTNRLQYAWLKMFAGPETAVFAVGDDDQSIYAFRGAQVGNMAAFEREFHVEQVIKLERNYRSFGNILDAANELISRNQKRLGKNLRTEAGPGEPVRVHESPTDYAEAQWFVDEARQLHREGTPRSDIALLYRSNAQSRVMESALFNAGVPYKVYGGLRFFERAEVKHALSYLRLIENPNDDTSFLRVVNFPARGIGSRTLEQLQDAARASGRSLYQSVGALSGKGGNNLQAFVAKVDAMREATRGLTLREIIVHVLEASGLVDFYKTDKEGRERLENLEELVNAAEAFVTQEGFGKDAVALPIDEHGPGVFGGTAGRAEFNTPGAEAVEDGSSIEPARARPGLFDGAGGRSAPAHQGAGAAVPDGAAAALAATVTPDAETGEIMSPLAAFLTHASLEAGDNQAQAGQDAIQLMTVHSAKGLEFDCVFITGLEEGLFPHENSASDPEGLEEERRLMYVAITRARKRLYLSFSQTRMLHGQTRYNVKSRFFDELPESALRWITPKNQGFGSGYSREYQAAWSRGSGLGSIVGTGREPAPPPKPLVSAKPPAHGLRSGQSVFHTKFGEGVILTLEGAGDDARAQVNFGRHGTKWLALGVAKLTPVE
ncbi:UvrD-helicase domain-containing protein [Piscinibacter koreensis]|uniref:DNA 3'-5' helicase n=1 Tax=Piscinibacter koreensis TaxID=2742824 RepID=A0A7Y6TVW9_9BURK|nr:UvrD-helicase domain-containing protein [Schlegelella koreensis]NUZ05433.1 UvrD-helicase domain-containing protein [Schlegelella koreensis]